MIHLTTIKYKVSCAVNEDQIKFIMDSKDGCTIHFEKDKHIHVEESLNTVTDLIMKHKARMKRL